MAQLTLTLHVRKRWLYRPAMIAIYVLCYLGILTDADAAVEWMAKHALRFEAR
ncbi:hypothetical protein [Sphingobium sp. WCS2017Hpa-17]|uniref:hypothetical protein n=1 Tax=Sphingobium sp. WCS2017Hpa-17 TaxID=3073638 RepID=UPI002889F259|nr:hypothetical protein [Sphingobium sp. WCS2017Hpa-17]